MITPASRTRARHGRARSNLLPIAVACGAAALVIAALGWSAQSSTTLIAADLAIVRAVHAVAFAEATWIATAITDLAATRAIFVTALVAAGVLLAARHWRGALSVLVAVGATQLVVALVKGLVERGRPPASSALVEPAGYSFPSAHSASAMAVYGLVALLAVQHARGSARLVIACLGVAVAVAVGATRIYLGAHYPSDVLAGWLVGALVAAAAWWIFARAGRARVAA